jgi:hypothetical protein
MALGLAMLIMSAAGLFLMFDSAQVVTNKARLVNAADASAYSAASWRARVFNYIAYSNRAIIAQEIAVAQAVTLDSYAHYFATFAESVDTLANFWPPLKAFTEAMKEAARYAKQITTKAASAEILLRDAPRVGYKTLLQHSQTLMMNAGNAFGGSAVANEVARTTDKRFFAFVLSDGKKYRNFTKKYESTSDRRRLQQVVLDTLDPFTAGERNQTTLMSAGFGCAPAEYRKRGGTILTPELERWEAGDTGSFHIGLGGLFRCNGVELYEMGWGGAESSVRHNSQRLQGNPGNVKDNPKAFRKANEEFGGSHSGTGIAKVYGLRNISGVQSHFQTSRLTVLAQMRGESIKTSATVGVGAGSLAKSPNWLGSKLWAVSSAEVYFSRPPDAPERTEYANLYNPYWQVRLVPVSDDERRGALGYAN